MIARRLLTPLVFLCALAMYVGTLAPSVAALFDDSLEFQLVGYRLAIAHPTGYPLYTLMLKASSYLPAGDVAYRANLLSALCAALAVALVYRVAARRTRSDLAGLVAASALAVSPVFWSQAVVAEVYALNAVIVAALLWAALPADDEGAFPGHPAAVACLLGLGLAHHRTIALMGIALGLAWLLARRRSRHAGASWARLAPAFGAPLLLYLYLPLRGDSGSLDGTYRNTPEGFLRWVSAADYTSFLSDNPFQTQTDAAYFGSLTLAQFGWVALALGALGIARWLWRGARRDAASLCLLAATLAYGIFVVTYRVPDVPVFAIPVFLLCALALGDGFAAVSAWCERALRQWTAVRVRPAVPVLLAALAAASLLPVYQSARAQNDLSGKFELRDYGRDIMAQRLPANSVLIGILGEMTLVRYFQATEHLQPALDTVAADRDAERLAAIEREAAAGRAVFTTRPLAGLAERYALGAAGPLVRVWASPPRADLPADAPRLEALRYRVAAVQALDARKARVILEWTPDAPLSADLKVSARLLAGEQVVAQQDGVPVHNAYPTSLWRPGARVDDVYDVALPSDAAPGVYRLLLIVYRAASGAEVGRIEAGEVQFAQ